MLGGRVHDYEQRRTIFRFAGCVRAIPRKSTFGNRIRSIREARREHVKGRSDEVTILIVQHGREIRRFISFRCPDDSFESGRLVVPQIYSQDRQDISCSNAQVPESL